GEAERTQATVARPDGPRDPRRPPARRRDPVPAERAGEAPAAVVRRGPAPALEGHPRPAVGGPDPPAVRVGPPAGRDVRPPHVADVRLVVPGAVALELARVGGDLLRDVLGAGVRPRVALAALLVPLGEIVARRAVEALRPVDRLAAPHVGALAGADGRRLEHRLSLVDGQARLAG